MKIIFALLVLLPALGFSQKQGNIWYFGNHAGIDFKSGSPVVINNGQTEYVGCPGCHAEGSSVICDSSGHLLFYTNGSAIWNKNQNVMENGDSLLSNFSSTQAAIIVPQPTSQRYFYVFTTDDFYIDKLKYGLRYSIVDMCNDNDLGNGLGRVLVNKKNILLLDTVAEKLTAVNHSNGVDYWVIAHKYYSDAFYAFHLSSTGITDTVISHVGSVHPIGLQTAGGAIGQLKASPDGKKLALVNGNSSNNIAEYFDFDKSSGVVSNWVNIQWDSLYQFYGVSFSPDNSKLYIACDLNGNGIYQFNLSAGGGNPDSVKASKIKIASGPNFFGLQLANNGKIYSAASPFLNNYYLGVINFPNNPGIGCNYIDSAVNLNGHGASYGFPNFIDSYNYSNKSVICNADSYTEEDISKQVSLFPNPFNNLLHIRFGNEYSIVQLRLIDVLGMEANYPKIRNEQTILLNETKIHPGIYFYQLFNEATNEIIATGKLVKQ